MTAQNTRRTAAKSWLVTATAALVALSGLALAPAAASADEPSYGAAVTSINGAAPSAKWPNVAINAGSTLTVTGTFPESFNDSTPSGAYVQWCLKPADAARPVSGTCDSSKQLWLSSTALGSPYNMPATGTVADGTWTFSADLTPPSSIAGTECGADGAGECGLYIRPDHRFGSAVTEYDQFIPIRFASNLGEANLSVSNLALADGKLSLNAAATDVVFETNGANTDTGSANAGAYFSLIEAGTYGDLTQANMGIAVNYAYVPPTATTVSSTLSVDLTKLDATKKYEVVAWRAHGNPSAERYLGATALEIPTATTVKASTSSPVYNGGHSFTVTVGSDAGTPTGNVELTIDGKTYPAVLSGGKATVKLSKLIAVDTHPVAVSYLGNGEGTLFAPSNAEANFTVGKATPTVSIKLLKKSVKTNEYGSLKVTAAIPGSLKAKASKFTVTVYDGSKAIKTTKLDSSGTITMKLPKIAKTGTHQIKVAVSATANTNSAKSVAKPLKVVRS